MLPFFSDKFGNAASASHKVGWEAKAHLDVARESVLQNMQALPDSHLIFTSGATEANNLAIKGLLLNCDSPQHIITQKTEHACVLESCEWLKRFGHEVTVLDVDSDGFVKVEDFKNAFKPNTKLVSFMLANNEIGTIQNIKDLVKITREQSKAFFHTDAVQAFGKMPVSFVDLGVDMMSVSAHKMYGPKGIGALCLAPTIKPRHLQPLLHGGGHEEGLRSGTVNLAGVVGLAKALEVAVRDLAEQSSHLSKLRDFLLEALLKIEGVSLNGSKSQRLCQNINVTVDGVLAENLILQLPHFGFSTGSACASGKTEPSYVIQALGKTELEAKCSLRLGLGRGHTQEQMETVAKAFFQKISALRA